MSEKASAAAYLAVEHIGAIPPAPTSRNHPDRLRVPRTADSRLEASLSACPFDVHRFGEEARSKKGTILYLAYGSNLCNETFRGKRGIRPLSQINVQVPSLRMTFDLPGIPYTEPCFANSARRDPQKDVLAEDGTHAVVEKGVQVGGQTSTEDYHKDRWHKGMIGVVYEVTPEDYAHIIATEGGGSGYQDIVVDCHPFASSDPMQPVPQSPTLPAFRAHTLFAPAVPPDEQPPKDGGHFQRPDTSYAQASARYLKLITDGAAELQLPYEYQDYLHSLRPYTITTNKQRLGQFSFSALWMPFIVLLFALGKVVGDKDGRAPRWFRQLMGAVFKAAWVSYDSFFFPLFGDGERTISDENAVESGIGRVESPQDGNWCLDRQLEKGFAPHDK